MAVCCLLPSSRFQAYSYLRHRKRKSWGPRKNDGKYVKWRERPTSPPGSFLFEVGKALGKKVGRGLASARSRNLSPPIFLSPKFFALPPSSPPHPQLTGRLEEEASCFQISRANFTALSLYGTVVISPFVPSAFSLISYYKITLWQ